uniref:TGF-beta family profile domain-containing protein n=1 Tax=Knipowitschia caucasica TaxID=637954 RepID=A0AAV2KPA3_KNICA
MWWKHLPPNAALCLPSSDHHFSFTVQYHLDTLPSERLIRASFIHLRSSRPSAIPPRCHARLSSGPGARPKHSPASPPPSSALHDASLNVAVVLEPHDRWAETDITAHVLQDPSSPLTLTAHYRCSLMGDKDGDRPWRRWFSRAGQRKAPETHLEVPSLLLYLQEERQVSEWMSELLGQDSENIVNQIRYGHTYGLQIRQKRSEDLSQIGAGQSKDMSNQNSNGLPATQRSSEDSSQTRAELSKKLSQQNAFGLPETLQRRSKDLSLNRTARTSTPPQLPPNYKRKKGTTKSRCRLHSIRLTFEQLGLGNHFIAPPFYNPRFCRGDCPREIPYGFNSPNHAIIQNSIHGLRLGDVPMPSCVPYKYLPLSVLVAHTKGVEYKALEDMVAESCTCR